MDDLNLWLDFLKSAEKGQKPKITTFLDSSELGIGGSCPKMGIGWRYQFNPEEQRAFTLNTKEYNASAIDMDP